MPEPRRSPAIVCPHCRTPHLSDALREAGSHVRAHPEVTTADVGRALGLTPQNAMRRLRELEARGIVTSERTTAPSGGVEVVWAFTDTAAARRALRPHAVPVPKVRAEDWSDFHTDVYRALRDADRSAGPHVGEYRGELSIPDTAAFDAILAAAERLIGRV